MAEIVRAGVLVGFCQLTQFQGYDPAALLNEVGLCESDLEDSDHYLRRRDVIALLELAAKRLDCPDFGLRLAEVQDVYILGALAFVIRNAQNLRSAIGAAAKYLHYHATGASLVLEADDAPSEERVVFDQGYGAPTEAIQMMEHAVGLFCRIAKNLTENGARPKRILFSHARISTAAMYERHFRLQPVFGANRNLVTLSRADLDLPLKTVDRPLQAMVERYLETHAPPPGPRLEMRARHATSHVMRANGRASMDDVAAMLRMHPRTLQRGLKANGATFESIRDDVRRSLAEIYLGNDIVPIADVADLVGYASQSVLNRSSLRWFGKTPLALRRELAGRAR